MRRFDHCHGTMVLLHNHLYTLLNLDQHGVDVAGKLGFCNAECHLIFDDSVSSASPSSASLALPPYFGTVTAGMLASRTSLLKAARSVVNRPFSERSLPFTSVARSSYTTPDWAVGWLSELSISPIT